MGDNMKLVKKILLVIIGVFLTVLFIGYVLINRGIKREIANNITVGEDINIPSKNGTIRASLFNNLEKSPAVILITGSGANSYRSCWEKDNTEFWKPLTELLYNEGYTVLLLEKRGINGSAGHWEKQSFEDRANDVKDAIDYLKSRNDIEHNRIGLIGHSQGGWIVQLSSVMYRDDIEYIVNLAGPSISVMEQVLDDYKGEYKIAGFTNEKIQKKIEGQRNILEIVKKISPIIQFGNISHIIGYDSEYIRKNITVPIFAVYAENDVLVLPERNKKLLEEGLRISKNNSYEIYTVSNADHRFKIFDTSDGKLKDVKTSEEFFEIMKRFIMWEKELYKNNW
jgi:pimeloyl-ACP methyl ester carboxylesterase